MANWELIEEEFIISTMKSSGAGGQHVNKVETRVRLCFSIEESKALSLEEKELLMVRYEKKLNKMQMLCLSVQKYRSQLDNKIEAIEKMKKLISDGLIREKKRKKTKVPKAEKQKRLEEKKTRALIKSLRKKPEL